LPSRFNHFESTWRAAEFVQFGRSTMTVYAPPENAPNGPERREKLSSMLIESIAPLLSPAVSNGQ
jgi:hypothetical protein